MCRPCVVVIVVAVVIIIVIVAKVDETGFAANFERVNSERAHSERANSERPNSERANSLQETETRPRQGLHRVYTEPAQGLL